MFLLILSKSTHVSPAKLILDLKMFLDGELIKTLSLGITPLVVTSRTLKLIFWYLRQISWFIILCGMYLVVCFKINCQYFAFIGIHWEPQTPKTNHVLNFNIFLTIVLIWDLMMSLNRVYYDLKLCL